MVRALSPVFVLILVQSGPAAEKVTVLKAPDGGTQPQVIADGKGTFHLIYFKGESGAGNLYYVHRPVGQARFSDPLRVNSQPDTAIATGTVRGGQIALGKGGRVHVAWNGAGKASGGMHYARLNDGGTGFEDQRNLMQVSSTPDGGCTVAADGAGNVYVGWHAVRVGLRGEENRKVWVARSTDEGKSFAEEVPAWAEPTGACGCCSMRMFADEKGFVYALYRSATGGDGRDIYVLASKEKGVNFQGALLHPWRIATCPMSTLSIAEGRTGAIAAWDTDGQVYFSTIKPGTTDFSKPQAAPGTGKGRKHPTVAVNAKGEMLLAWAEGTGWQRGGALAWQVYDPTGKPTEDKGRDERGIPVWGLPTAVGTDTGFILFH